MAISKLHGGYRQINPRVRTICSDRALLAKRAVRLEPNNRLSPQETFPSRPDTLRRLPEGILTISVGHKGFKGSRGSAAPEVLLGVLGGVGGFLAGCRLQYHIMEDIIVQKARELDQTVDFSSFMANPQIDLKSFGLMMAAGAVGFVMAGGLIVGLAQLVGAEKPQQ